MDNIISEKELVSMDELIKKSESQFKRKNDILDQLFDQNKIDKIFYLVNSKFIDGVKGGIAEWINLKINMQGKEIRVRIAELAEACGMTLRVGKEGAGLHQTSLYWGFKYALFNEGYWVEIGRFKNFEPIFEIERLEEKLIESESWKILQDYIIGNKNKAYIDILAYNIWHLNKNAKKEAKLGAKLILLIRSKIEKEDIRNLLAQINYCWHYDKKIIISKDVTWVTYIIVISDNVNEEYKKILNKANAYLIDMKMLNDEEIEIPELLIE